jgi:seryl-tRNA synthetase
MHDIKLIRENPKKFDNGLHYRGITPCAEKIIELDEKIRSATGKIQEKQARRNEIAKLVPEYKSIQKDVSSLFQEAEEIKGTLLEVDDLIVHFKEELNEILSSLPNIPDESVPFGSDEDANIEIRRVGSLRKFDFIPEEHYVLGEKLGIMDFEQTSKISGSRFVTLKKGLAKMERALVNFMLDIHTKKFDYMEIVPPVLVKSQAVFGVGQLPKFEHDLFKTDNGFYLISTGEVPLTNMVADKIVAEEDLPLRFAAYTSCFRSEAGSAGRDTTGMIRQHQFSKVELVSVVTEKDSEAEHERMLGASEEILKQLELPYRVMLLCSQEMGPSSRKTYDIEVWLPGQGRYREISSCSNCGDFQARRMKARYKVFHQSNMNKFLHTLNGSGLPIGRTMIAILENYQNADGSIEIPKNLQPYMDGMKKISKE